MNSVAELARVPNPRKNLKSGDFNYERITTSEYFSTWQMRDKFSRPPPMQYHASDAESTYGPAGRSCFADVCPPIATSRRWAVPPMVVRIQLQKQVRPPNPIRGSATLNEHQPHCQQPSGCLTAFALGVCVTVLLVVGAIGGAISYFVADMAGAGSTGSYIGGAATAFVVVWLTCPAGIAIQFFFLLNESGSMTRSLVSLLMAIVVPIHLAPIILVFATLAAIPGALVFQWCQPLTAAILIATVFPLIGLVTGVMVGNPEPSSHG